jgi:hypothetical protein
VNVRVDPGEESTMSAGNAPRPGPNMPLGDPNLPLPVAVRILIVTDDDGSFTASHKFGLTELIAALEAPSLSLNVTVTKAHRETGIYAQDADIPSPAKPEGFHFDNPDHFDAADFDEIWFFGVRFGGETVSLMSEAELRIVTEFMESGGGVFATGDHESLGAPLSGELPRVRSMRRWTYDYSVEPDDFDPASGHGPPVQGKFRHDTLVPGHDPAFTFDDQSDDIAAAILPTRYTSGNKYIAWSFPHPLLCTSSGVIEVLPDHMHEGECVVPADLGQSTSFDGHTSPEYPLLDGVQPVPDVVARGIVTSHTTDNPGTTVGLDDPSIAQEFGCIGAYDGHPVKIGRVVVDSTFHHFFNINITGAESQSDDPVKQQGFYASAEGMEQYKTIKAYWRNIATWLAPPHSQASMFYKAMWLARWDSQIRMAAPNWRQRRRTWKNVMHYGAVTHSVMARLFSPCTTIDWVFAQDNPLAKYKWWLILTLPDPPWERFSVNLEEVMTGMLGEVMIELIRASPERDEAFARSLDQRMPEIVRSGYHNALRMAVSDFRQRTEETERFLGTVAI